MKHPTRVMHIALISTVFAAAMTCGLVAPVVAQQPPEGTTLQEVLVTAQMRSENLQTVPLSLSVFSASDLQNQNIDNFQDLKTRIPSFVYDEFSQGQPRYYIRGIGNNLQSGGVDEDVGVFVDGVYLSRPAMTDFEFPDLERVEVLRGPQGTLFGRNVVGGAISFVTRKPTDQTVSEVQVTRGNYDLTEIKALASGPLADKLYGSISGVSSNHNGYAFNTTNDTDVLDTQFAAVRGTLRFVPTDALDMQLSGDASRRRGTGQWWVLYSAGPGMTTTDRRSTPWSSNNYPDDGVNNVDNYGFNLNIDWRTALGTFTSISAYRNSRFESRANETQPTVPPGPYPFGTQLTPALAAALATGQYSNIAFIAGFNEQAHQISQELRLASPGDLPLRWVVGAYYFNSKVSFDQPTTYIFLYPYFFVGEGSYGATSNTTTDSYAAFANVSYDLLQNLTAQAGIRWTHDRKQFTGEAYGNYFGGPYTYNGGPVPPDIATPGGGYIVSNDLSWTAYTPAFSLNYRVTPDAFLYVAASKGFKSGGFNGFEQDAAALRKGFDPEYAWNYELGAKTEWFDKRVRLNISAFYVDYTNLQLRGQVSTGPNTPPYEFTTNAGKTYTKGIETELDWLITPDLDLYGSYTYMRSRITEITNPEAASVLHVGDELIKTPKNKVFIGGRYSTALTAGLSGAVRVDWAYTSSYWAQLPNNDPNCLPGPPYCELVPSQRTLGAGLSLQGHDGHWMLEVWGKNLTDEVHPNSITAVQGSTYAFWDPPRTWGVTATWRN